MAKLLTIIVVAVFGLRESVAVGRGCLGWLEGMAPDSVARQHLFQNVRLAFVDAERLQREGNYPEAKKARLGLAKAVAAKANLPWPASLSDDVAADLIWAAHTLPSVDRRSGFRGLREYFSRYTHSEHPELRDFKKALGSNLARELLRRGVCGDEQALLDAVGAHSLNRTPRLVLADFLDEHERFASGETLRLRAEQQSLPALRENLSRLEAIRIRLEAIAETAMQEWRESDLSVRLATVGEFTSLAKNGLPILTPTSRAALFSSTAEQQRWIPALNLSRGGWTALDIEGLTKLKLIHVTSLDLGHNRIGPVGASHLAGRDSPFKNVTLLFLRNNELGAAGAGHLAGTDSPFKNVTSLELDYNEIGAVGARHLAGKDSPFKNVASLSLYYNRIDAEGASYLAAKESPFKNVTVLSLGANEIDAVGAGHLAGKDSSFKNVTSLLLGNNRIGPVGAGRLAGKDSPFKNVTLLNLYYNQIRAAGVGHLAGKDSPFKNVALLFLEHNQIGAAGAGYFIRPSSPFRLLKRVNLEGNDIPQAAIDRINLSLEPLARPN